MSGARPGVVCWLVQGSVALLPKGLTVVSPGVLRIPSSHVRHRWLDEVRGLLVVLAVAGDMNRYVLSSAGAAWCRSYIRLEG